MTDTWPEERSSGAQTNVGKLERYASVGIGGLLLLNGIRKPSMMGLVTGITGAALIWRGASGHCAVYGAARISTAVSTDGLHIREESPEVVASLTVGRGAEELYNLWREPSTLAPIMAHFAEVTALDGAKLTHWRVHSPIEKSVEWDSELTVERPGEELSWASKPGTLLPNEGSVYFKAAPGDRGTEVKVRFRFQPPLGTVGDAAAKAFATVPRKIAEMSLRHLKSLAETGELPTLAQNSSGRGESDLL